MKIAMLLAFFSLVHCYAFTAQGAVIGTYTEASDFNLLGGNFLGGARDALLDDGHSFAVLNSGDLATNLASVDIVYLSASFGNNILDASQVTIFQDYVLSGGTLVVQADLNAYDNLLSAFGISTSFAQILSRQSITTPYAPLTSGPHGTVVQTYVANPSQLTLPEGGLLLDTANSIGVLDDGFGLGAGAGTLIVYGDANMFDFNFIGRNDNLALWRNTFELIPEPTTVTLAAFALVGLVGFPRRATRL